MIFKTTDDGERIISFFNKAKIESENFAKQLEKDTIFLTEYFNATGDVAKQQAVLNKATNEASKSAIEYTVSTKGAAGAVSDFEQQQIKANSSIKKSKNYFDLSSVSANAYKLTVKGVALVANMASTALLSGLAYAFTKLFTAQNEAIEKAKELTSTYKSSNSSIEDYKQQINTLVTELNSSNISYEDSKTKRKELMTIQDELFKKYGTEEQVIKSITAAINGEVDALDTLSQKSYYEWLASVDSLNGWQKFGNGFYQITTFGAVTDQYKSALDSAVDYMEDKTQFFYVKTTGNEELDNLIQEKFGLYKNDFNEFVIKDMVPEEAYELLSEIRTAYRDNAVNYLGTETDNILTTVNDSIQSAMTTIDNELYKHQETYHTYLEGMIKYDSEYSDEYADLLSKRVLLEEAELSINDEGKEQRILEAKKEFYDSLNNAITSAENNDNVRRYFENLYPDLYSEISSWNFEYDISANTNGLADIAEEIGEKYTATDLLGMIDDESAVITDSAFNSLIDKSIEYGICTNKSTEEVQKLIDLLVELGVVQDNVKGDTFNDEIDNFTPTISSSVEQISRQLEPQFSKLGDAYSSIFPDGGFNLDVVDNSMLENLREAFAEIDEEIGVTFDANKINEFFDIIADESHTVDEVHDAFNDLATAYFYSTDTLEHLNEATAESIKQQLEQMGVVNSEEIIDHYLQLAEAENGLLELQEQLAEARKNLIESSNTGEYESAKGRLAFIYKQIEAYYNEKGATEDLRIALFNLQLQQAGLSIDSINSSTSVSELLSLASAAGLSAEYMDRLVYLQDLFNQYNSATNSNMQSAIYAQIQSVSSSLQKDLDNSQLDLKFDFPSGKASGAGSAGKDAAEEYLEGFHNELDRLKFLQDNGFITEKEYLDQLRILYENYFKDREEYLEEYVKYEHEYLNGLKSLYEDVLGGITDLLDDQIDKIEEERDAKMDALEEEQEARTKALELQKEQLDLQIEEIEAQIKGKNDAIDAINDEIDAIKEANNERQRQIDLQKAQYDLERMQNQRTILQYSEDKGMHYVNDTSGIRDAKDAVDDAKREIEIADKEKQIALIEDEISLLETRKSLIEDQQADLDNQINALDEYYKKLIENTEAYYSALIQPIEDYKTQFESIAEIESDATFDEQLKSLGYSVDEILALSSSTLENFKSNYLGILSDIYAGNSQMLDSLSMVSGLDQDSFVGYLSQSQPYIDSLARLDLSSTQLAIDSANNGIHSFADGAVLATTNMTTMADTVTSLLEGDKKQAGIISSFETMTSVLADANTQIAGIASGMEALDGKTATIRINIETTGDTSLLGNAHVSGTAITGASHVEGTALASGNWAVQSNEKHALVGEIGRELIVRGGRFFTVGNYGAEMFNIKKGDIVFNHEQTEALLKNGHISGRGKAYADGTVGSGRFLTGDGRILRPLQEGDRGFDLLQKFQTLVDRIIKGEEGLINNAVFDSQKQFEQMLKTIMNNTAINNISNSRNSQPVVHQQFNITMPNVTNSTSAETLMNDLQSLSTKKFQMDW